MFDTIALDYEKHQQDILNKLHSICAALIRNTVQTIIHTLTLDNNPNRNSDPAANLGGGGGNTSNNLDNVGSGGDYQVGQGGQNESGRDTRGMHSAHNSHNVGVQSHGQVKVDQATRMLCKQLLSLHKSLILLYPGEVMQVLFTRIIHTLDTRSHALSLTLTHILSFMYICIYLSYLFIMYHIYNYSMYRLAQAYATCTLSTQWKRDTAKLQVTYLRQIVQQIPSCDTSCVSLPLASSGFT